MFWFTLFHQENWPKLQPEVPSNFSALSSTYANLTGAKTAHKVMMKLTQGVFSPTFYDQLFFTCLQLMFVLFWQMNLDQKPLVKCWWNWLQGSISPSCLGAAFTLTNPKTHKDTQFSNSVFWRFGDLCGQKLLIKCWYNWPLESISPTFYEWAFDPNYICQKSTNINCKHVKKIWS